MPAIIKHPIVNKYLEEIEQEVQSCSCDDCDPCDYEAN